MFAGVLDYRAQFCKKAPTPFPSVTKTGTAWCDRNNAIIRGKINCKIWDF